MPTNITLRGEELWSISQGGRITKITSDDLFLIFGRWADLLYGFSESDLATKEECFACKLIFPFLTVLSYHIAINHNPIYGTLKFQVFRLEVIVCGMEIYYFVIYNRNGILHLRYSYVILQPTS